MSKPGSNLPPRLKHARSLHNARDPGHGIWRAACVLPQTLFARLLSSCQTPKVGAGQIAEDSGQQNELVPRACEVTWLSLAAPAPSLHSQGSKLTSNMLKRQFGWPQTGNNHSLRGRQQRPRVTVVKVTQVVGSRETTRNSEITPE